MRILSRRNRVLWVNSIGYRAPTASGADLRRAFRKVAAAASPVREVEPNIFVLNPLAVPAYGSPLIRRFNREFLRFQVRRAMRQLGFGRPLNWVFNPAAGLMAGGLNEKAIIYYCVDEYTAFSGVDTQALADIEERLLERADLVITSAERLQRSKSPFNPRTFMVRHGVDFQHFRKALDPELEVPAEIRDLPRPLIGYFGLIAQDWVDLDLLGHVADRFPHGSLVMLGKITTDVSGLERRPNVHLLGRKRYEDLPAYCKGFDAAVIPFPISEVTLNANPLKAREYLAAGLPVVSTAIPEVEVLEHCLIGRDPEDFVRQLHRALEEPGPRWDRSETMRDESWEARVETIRGLFASIAAAGSRNENQKEPS
ncbi:MAG: glycosyltransferase [Isosphaeraceae bacterium]